jgi:hypothetical protein
MSSYVLEKEVWSESDFTEMGWHDSIVYSSVANPDDFEYLLDLDYIFQWVHPKEDGKSFKFWVAPVTMVFDNVSSIQLDIESEQGYVQVSNLGISDPQKTPNGKFTTHAYRFECQEGIISLRATGYRMFVREHPKLLGSQFFGLKERGGVSFSRKLNAL